MQINYQFYWFAKNCEPTEDDIEAAQRTIEEIIKKELKDGLYATYPRVCYFVPSAGKVETLWPHILSYKDEKTGVYRYVGTSTLELTLRLRQQKQELHDSFEAHREWYEESLKKFKEKLKKHKSLLNGNHFNNKYGVAPTIGNLKEWLFERYGPKLKLHLQFTEDKETGITWIKEFNFDFPNITKAFEREVREEDLHIFCREIVDRQKEIEKRLEAATTQKISADKQNDSSKKEYSARQVALFYNIVSEAYPEKYMLKDHFCNNNEKYLAITQFIQDTFNLPTCTPERFERMTNEVAMKEYKPQDRKVVLQLLKDHGFSALAVRFSNNT